MTEASDGASAPIKPSHTATAQFVSVSDAKPAGSAVRLRGQISLAKAKPLLPARPSRPMEHATAKHAPAKHTCESRLLADAARASSSMGWLPAAPSPGTALKELQGVLTNEMVSPVFPARCRSAIGCENGRHPCCSPKAGSSLCTSDGSPLTPSALRVIRNAAIQMALQPVT